MPGRLVATIQDQQRLRDDVAIVQLDPVDLGVHEDAHQVVRRRLSPFGDHPGGVLVVGHAGRRRPLHRLVALLPEHRHHVLAPAEQQCAVLLPDPERIGDHDQRQPRRDVVHEVALAALADPVDEHVDDAAGSTPLSHGPAGG